MSRIISFTPLFVLLVVLPSNVDAQSIWKKRNSTMVNLFTDTQARHVGDTLTILVREKTDVENKDERALSKETDTGALFNFNSNDNGQASSVQADGQVTSDRSFDGSSEYTVERDFTDRISVSVIDKQPNGNLVVGGKRQHFVQGEVRTFSVSGIVRPVDIRPDNSVESRFVASFQMTYVGKGPESEFSNQGWLGRVVNVLWPF
ncbi:MAG: flagellar basal body L-ring protein FlgH [Pirellulaceae bacterium]